MSESGKDRISRLRAEYNMLAQQQSTLAAQYSHLTSPPPAHSTTNTNPNSVPSAFSAARSPQGGPSATPQSQPQQLPPPSMAPPPSVPSYQPSHPQSNSTTSAWESLPARPTLTPQVSVSQESEQISLLSQEVKSLRLELQRLQHASSSLDLKEQEIQQLRTTMRQERTDFDKQTEESSRTLNHLQHEVKVLHERLKEAESLRSTDMKQEVQTLLQLSMSNKERDELILSMRDQIQEYRELLEATRKQNMQSSSQQYGNSPRRDRVTAPPTFPSLIEVSPNAPVEELHHAIANEERLTQTLREQVRAHEGNVSLLKSKLKDKLKSELSRVEMERGRFTQQLNAIHTEEVTYAAPQYALDNALHLQENELMSLRSKVQGIQKVPFSGSIAGPMVSSMYTPSSQFHAEHATTSNTNTNNNTSLGGGGNSPPTENIIKRLMVQATSRSLSMKK